MKTSKFSKQEQLAVLAEVDAGATVEEVTRKHGISGATYYKWKKNHADEADDEKRRLKELESENARLKKMYAELMIDHQILQEGYEFIKKAKAQRNQKK